MIITWALYYPCHLVILSQSLSWGPGPPDLASMSSNWRGIRPVCIHPSAAQLSEVNVFAVWISGWFKSPIFVSIPSPDSPPIPSPLFARLQYQHLHHWQHNPHLQRRCVAVASPSGRTLRAARALQHHRGWGSRTRRAAWSDPSSWLWLMGFRSNRGGNWASKRESEVKRGDLARLNHQNSGKKW